AVLIGSFLSSSVPDRFVRPAIAFVIFASGLKYVGLDTTVLGWVLCATLLGAGLLWVASAAPWRSGPGRRAYHEPEEELLASSPDPASQDELTTRRASL